MPNELNSVTEPLLSDDHGELELAGHTLAHAVARPSAVRFKPSRRLRAWVGGATLVALATTVLVTITVGRATGGGWHRYDASLAIVSPSEIKGDGSLWAIITTIKCVQTSAWSR